MDVADGGADGFHIGRLIGVAPEWHGPGEPFARYLGEGGEALTFLSERARRERGDGRGIEPAAEIAADRVGAAHLAADRPVETLPQAVGIGLIGTEADRADVGWRPVAALRHGAVGAYGHQVSRQD